MTTLTPIAAGEISTARLVAQIDGALRTLAVSADPAEIVKIHGMAEAIRYAVKRARLGLETQNPAAKLRLRVERRLGELLADGLVHGRPSKSIPSDDNFRLSDFEISLNMSARAQKIAAMPATEFESYFQSAYAAGWEITWGGVNGLMYRAEADIFDLARQSRRNGSYYRADTAFFDPVRQKQYEHKKANAASENDFSPALPVKPLVRLWHGDCLNLMSQIPDASVDLLLTDPPYGSGEFSWDQSLDLPTMWGQFKRIMKPNRPMILFSTQPFASKLVLTAEKEFGMQMLKIELIWWKNRSADFVLANDRPLRYHENILVFSTGVTINERQTTRRMPYYPLEIAQDDRYPRTVLDEYPTLDTDRGLHPMQKPVGLLSYLTKLFSRPGEVVLDSFMGSGSTGVAAAELGRHFIGIEREQQYFDIAAKRLEHVTGLSVR